jgi:hypothetical protein
MADNIDTPADAPVTAITPPPNLASAERASAAGPEMENTISPAAALDLSLPVKRASDYATEPEDIAYERSIDEVERIGIALAEARLRREDETERPLTGPPPPLQRPKPPPNRRRLTMTDLNVSRSSAATSPMLSSAAI